MRWTMIGVFDSGLGGLTVLRALVDRFPRLSFAYLGDHAHVPYGNRPSEEIVTLTRYGVEHLFKRGCRLVLLGCNTATTVAARRLQRDWLPASPYAGRNILGIVAPTVEAATQTPWAVSTPQYPQKFNTDLIAVLGTARTVASGVYAEEIRKRCPRVRIVQQACVGLAGAIEDGAPESHLDTMIEHAVHGILEQTGGEPPHHVILGCTHFPLVEQLFRRHLPPFTRVMSQPAIVCDSLEDYLARHPDYAPTESTARKLVMLTTGDPDRISTRARIFWPEVPQFSALNPG